MMLRGFARLACAALVAALALTPGAARADDANKTIKIGVVYDLTGPFAGGGSELHYLGAKIMIDWFNAHGGIDGYKVEAIYADAQSKPEPVPHPTTFCPLNSGRYFSTGSSTESLP